MAVIALVVAVAVYLLTYSLALSAYRLLLHPLARSRIPGPKLAALTFLYEFWIELFHGTGGLFVRELDRWHDEYGPLVRVTPDEVHVRDHSFVKTLFAGPGKVRHKDPALANAVGSPGGTFGTVAHHAHHARRHALSALFTKRSILDMQPVLWHQADRLCKHLKRVAHAGDVVNLRLATLAWSTDSMTAAIFKQSEGLLNDEPRTARWFRCFRAIGNIYPYVRQCQWIIPVALRLPIAPLELVLPDLGILLRLHSDMIDLARQAVDESTQKQDPKSVRSSHPGVFQVILDSNLPEAEKQPHRMAHEGLEIMTAGSGTTARALGLVLFHVLDNPHVLRRLQSELKSVMPDPNQECDLKSLESLPYLTATVKEALRLGNIVTSRLTLIAEEPLVCGEHVLPAGTPIGMTPSNYSMDRGIYTEPNTFAPERWLESSPDQLGKMAAYWLPFARGNRGCLGWRFALYELYIATACVFRRLDLELVDTIRQRDVDHGWNYLIGEPSKTSKGIFARVNSCSF